MSDDVTIPFDMTNRDYQSIRDQLITYVQTRFPTWNPTNSSDFGVVLLEAFALIGDNLSYYLDRIANETNIATATQPNSVFALSRQLGYEPGLKRAANVLVLFANSSASTVTIPAQTLITAKTTINGVSKNLTFETQTSLTLTASAQEYMILLEGFTHDGSDGTGEPSGTSDGTSNQIFTVSALGVEQGSMRVIVNDGSVDTEWAEVQNLFDYGPGDFVFQTHSNPNGSAYVQFGNGTNGAIPTANSTIKLIYRACSGAYGNIGSSELTTIATAVPTGVTFTQQSAGYAGSNSESLASIRQNAPAVFYSQRRALTGADFAAIAEGLSGVSKANADVSIWSNPVVYCAPADDGSYTPGQLVVGTVTSDALSSLQVAQAALQTAAMSGTTVSVAPPSYVGIALAVTCYLDPRTSQAKADIAVYDTIQQLCAFSNQDFGMTLSTHDVLFAISQIKSSLLLATSKKWDEGTNSSGGGGGKLKHRQSGPQSRIRGVSGTGHVQYADVTALYRKDVYSSGLHVPTTGKAYEIFYLNAAQTSRAIDTTTVPLLPTVTYGDLTITLSGGVYDLS